MTQIALCILTEVLSLFFTGSAEAYIGPGAGFAVVSPILLISVTLLLTLLGILFFPFRYLYKKIKDMGRQSIPKEILKKKKVVILGLDGLDPVLLERFLSEGKLPHINIVIQQGGYRRLQTTTPPESPVAWSSFTTGCNPGKHNIFDFLMRNPDNYLPSYSIAETRPPRWTLRLRGRRFPLSSPKVVGFRKETPFWHYLAERGIPAVIQRVPVTYPPEPFDGRLLSAMGVPDLLGTQGSFTFFTTCPGKAAEKRDGRVVTVKRQGALIKTEIAGPDNSFRSKKKPVCIEIRIHILSEKEVKIEINKQVIPLSVGVFSDWVKLEFPLGFFLSVKGIVRFLLKEIEPEFKLYMSPINIDPEAPAMPISYPWIYSKYLALSTGRFSTLGLAEDTSALNEKVLTPQEFLSSCEDVYRERHNIFTLELDKMKRGLLVHVFDITDRVQHMFWQYTDPGHPNYNKGLAERFGGVIEDVYIKMDSLVGEVLDRTDEDTLLMIMSDHGFNSFRYAFNLNTWLLQNGYISLKDGLKNSPEFFSNVDWQKTRAYALGLNGLYINTKGRETKGIVEKRDLIPLKKELKKRLEDYCEPESGRKVFRSVHLREDIYEGDCVCNAPDLVTGYERNFRASWQTALGGIPEGVVEDNNKNWSGDHCVASDLVPGVLICNKRIVKKHPSIMDIAPSVLKEFKMDVPKHMDGETFFE